MHDDLGLPSGGARDANTYYEVAELFIPQKEARCEFVSGDTLDEKVEAFARRVAILDLVPLDQLLRERDDLPDVLRRERRVVGLAEAEVDTPRPRAVEDLPDHALLYAAQPPRRLELAQRR